MKLFLYTLLQLTWGLPQTLLGFLLFLVHLKNPHHYYKGAITTEWNSSGGISLGLFIFIPNTSFKRVNRQKVTSHEYAHTIQSLLLGPSYLIIIGVPSFIWANFPYFVQKRKKSTIHYSSFYTERWADHLAGKYNL